MATHDSKKLAKRRQAPTHETYHDWLLRSKAAGNYFIFFRPFFFIVQRKLDALFLQDIINLASKRGAIYDDRGYFLCTTVYLDNDGWTRHEQVKHFQSLTKAGFLKTVKKGLPAQRWVRVDILAIEEALERSSAFGAKCGDQSTANGVDQPTAIAVGNNGTPTEYLQTEERAELPTRATPARADSAGDGADEDLLGDTPARPNKPGAHDAERISRLRRFAAEHGWTVSRSPKRWNGALQALKRKLKGDAARLDAVLDFIVGHNVTKPRVYDFAQLGAPNVWNWVTAMMEEDAERNPQVEISAEAHRVVALVTQGQPLPAGARAELPAAVQLSLDALADLRRRILKAHPKCKAPVTGPRHLTMLAPEDRFPWLVQSRLGPSLVQHFFEGVAGWAAGKTNLRLIPKRVVSVDNEDFQKWGMGLALEHGNAHHWTRLMKEIGR